HDARRRPRRRDVAVAAAVERVAHALDARLRAAGIVRDAQYRLLAVAEAELEAVIAPERVRQEVGAVRLHVPGRAHRLVGADERAAVGAGRAVVQRLDVPEAVPRRAGARRVVRRVGLVRDVAAVTAGVAILEVEEEAAADVGRLVVEHQLFRRDPRVLDLVRRVGEAPRRVAELRLRLFRLRRRVGAAVVPDLVVAEEDVTELVGPGQLVVHLALDVLDDRLVFSQALLHLAQVGEGDRAGQLALLLRRDQILAERPQRRVEEVGHADVDVLAVHRAPVPQLVLHDRPARFDRPGRDLLQRVAGEEAVGAGGEQFLLDVVGLHLVVLERPVERALEHVAAALGHEVDRQAGRLHRDVAAAGGHLDLIERVEVEVDRRRVRREVGDRPAFEVPLHVGRGAAHRRSELLPRLRAADVVAGELYAGSHVDDLPRVARGRDLLQDVRGEDGAGRDLLGVDDGRFGGYRVLFRHLTDLELLIDSGAESGSDEDIGTYGLLEARNLERYGIGADGNAWELVRTAFAGLCHEGLLKPGAGDRDRHARQHAARRVGDFPEDGSESLCMSWSSPCGEYSGGKHSRAQEHPGHTCHNLSSSVVSTDGASYRRLG